MIKFVTDTAISQIATAVVTQLRTETTTALTNKVDKVAGKELSSNDFTTAYKDKLDAVETGATEETAATIKTKYESNANTNAFTDAEKTKLTGIAAGATNTAEETAATIKTKYESNTDTNAFTDAEKTKLAGLESSHFKGEFVNLAALNNVTGAAGDYAYVDLGASQDVTTYIWDTTDNKWVDQKGVSTSETAATIKTKYESNANTNAYTDTEKVKLSGIEDGANVNENAFGVIVAGSTNVASTVASDTLTLLPSTGIDITATGKVITFASVDATNIVKGIIRLATDAEATAGTSTVVVPTVKQVKDAITTASGTLNTTIAAKVGSVTSSSTATGLVVNNTDPTAPVIGFNAALTTNLGLLAELQELTQQEIDDIIDDILA
jgi:hypothetical protein